MLLFDLWSWFPFFVNILYAEGGIGLTGPLFHLGIFTPFEFTFIIIINNGVKWTIKMDICWTFLCCVGKRQADSFAGWWTGALSGSKCCSSFYKLNFVLLLLYRQIYFVKIKIILKINSYFESFDTCLLHILIKIRSW